jgi:hypothetical protein
VTFYTNCKLLYFLLPFLFLLSLFRLHFFPHPSRSVLGAYPVSYTNGTGSFSEVKRSGRGANYSPPSNAKVKRISTIIEVPLCAFTPGYRIKYFYLSFPFPWVIFFFLTRDVHRTSIFLSRSRPSILSRVSLPWYQHFCDTLQNTMWLLPHKHLREKPCKTLCLVTDWMLCISWKIAFFFFCSEANYHH